MAGDFESTSSSDSDAEYLLKAHEALDREEDSSSEENDSDDEQDDESEEEEEAVEEEVAEEEPPAEEAVRHRRKRRSPSVPEVTQPEQVPRASRTKKGAAEGPEPKGKAKAKAKGKAKGKKGKEEEEGEAAADKKRKGGKKQDPLETQLIKSRKTLSGGDIFGAGGPLPGLFG